MNLLLDTQAFLWLYAEKEKVSPAALKACADPQNALWLSVASAWEMQIKSVLGKLRLGRPLDELIAEQQNINGLQVLSVELAHVLALNQLANHHKDPFDRLLIAQAKHHDWTAVSSDPEFKKYGISVLW